MKKNVLLSIAVVVAITVSVLVITGRKPADLTIAFPEMSAAQREFILPLINGYREKTSGNVRYEFIKGSEIYRELESGESSSDLYYLIRNFQFKQMREASLFSSLSLKKSSSIPSVLASDPHFAPVSWYPWGIVYNKRVFRELELSEPETWDDFLQICEEIKKSDLFPFSLMTKIKWPSSIWFDYISILFNGEPFHRQLLAGEIPFTDNRVRTVFSEIRKLHENGYILMDSESFEWQSMIEFMEDEKTLMSLSGSFFYDNAPVSLKENLGWFSFPEVKTMVASSSGFISPAGSENQRAVKIFLDYVLSEDGQRIIQSHSELIAVDSSVLEELGREDLKAAVSQLDKYDSVIPSFERNTHEDLIIPVKSAVNSLYSMTDITQLDTVLEQLEEYRLNR